jgi:type IV secretory pathway VirB2 component (pilin)
MIAGLCHYRLFMKYIQYITLCTFHVAYAAKNLTQIEGSDLGLPGPDNISNFTINLRSVIGILQDITAIIAVIGVCIVGIMYIMSRGNEEKTESAKKYMIHIVIGILLAFAAWGIMSLINIIPNSFNL